MVTIFHTERNDLINDKSYILTELRGLSTDSKPTQIETDLIENGSVFIEIDTQDVFIYDGENETWLPEAEEQEETQENVQDSRNILNNNEIESIEDTKENEER